MEEGEESKRRKQMKEGQEGRRNLLRGEGIRCWARAVPSKGRSRNELRQRKTRNSKKSQNRGLGNGLANALVYSRWPEVENGQTGPA